LLLANANYQHRPTPLYRFDSYRDDGWHLLTRTFVCTAPGSADTSLYLSLPTSGALYWQATAASVQEVEPLRPARIDSAPTKVLSFSGPAGAPPDPAQWNYELGGGGWGNDELQTYTASTANSQVDGNGNLVVTARREKLTGSDGIARNYTSARITTQGKVDVQPGSYVEAPIRAPVGAGVWPAFWLVGSSITRVGWPSAGELDVMEVTGGKETVSHSWMHMAARADPKQDMQYGGGKTTGVVDLGQPLDRETHLYGVYFDGSMVRFYVDHKEHLAYNADDALASGRTWPFGAPHFLVLNVAVGAAGGDPSGASFPKEMTVGPISIWQGGTPF
jgi:beta-glucanase (GH16 family)